MPEKSIDNPLSPTTNVVLDRVDFETTVDALLAKTVIRQHYRNVGNAAVEAEYKFPIAWQSVVTRFASEINGERYEAVAYTRQDAEEKYEDAVESGDMPIMIACDDALCTATVVNLLPGEKLLIEIETVEPIRIVDRSFVLRIPTTIDFRYTSDAMAENFEEPTSVAVNCFSDYPASARFRLRGFAAKGEIENCSHDFEVKRQRIPNGDETKNNALDEMLVQIENAKLNRDITLRIGHLPMPFSDGICPFGRIVKGYDDCVYGMFSSIASRENEPESNRELSFLDLRILVDCSGSMDGAAIREVRKALPGVLRNMTKNDTVIGLRFGSTVETWFRANGVTDIFKRRFEALYVPTIEADLGGTEMEAALDAALRLKPKTDRSDIHTEKIVRRSAVLLITDGDVWDIERLKKKASQKQIPIFIIAVGYAPADAPLEEIAEVSGGFVEYATPGEPIAELAARMVEAIRRQTVLTDAAVLSDAFRLRPDAIVTAPVAAAGISETTFLRWRSDNVSDVLSSAKNELFELAAEDDAVAKSAAYAFFKAAYADNRIAEAVDIACKNGFVTPLTNLLMVKVRAQSEKATGLPQFERIPQMPVFDDRELCVSYLRPCVGRGVPRVCGLSLTADLSIPMSLSLGRPMGQRTERPDLSLEAWCLDFIERFGALFDSALSGEVTDNLDAAVEAWWQTLNDALRTPLNCLIESFSSDSKQTGLRERTFTDWRLAVIALLLERLAQEKEAFNLPRLCEAIRSRIGLEEEMRERLKECLNDALD